MLHYADDYVSRFIGEVKAKNPAEPEFHQEIGRAHV